MSKVSGRQQGTLDIAFVPHQSPHHNYVEQVSIALVREYLYKKNFRTTLKSLHTEPGAFPGISDHRAPLAQMLGLETLLKRNKKNSTKGSGDGVKALDSMLEVVVKAFLKQHHQFTSGNRFGKSIQSQTEPFDLHSGSKCQKETQTKSEPFTATSVQMQIMSPPPIIDELNSNSVEDLDDSTYSTSDFIDPEQVESPPLSPPPIPVEVISHEPDRPDPQTGQKSPRLGRSLSASKSPTREDKDNYEDLNNDPSLVAQLSSTSTSPPSVAEHSAAQKSFDNEFVLKRPNPKNISSSSGDKSSNQNQPSSGGSISLAESLLQSKQNILAHGSLSQAEIHKRNRARRRSLSEDSQRMMNLPKLGRQVKPVGGSKSQERDDSCKLESLELCDIENEDLGFEDSFKTGHGSGGGAIITRSHLPKIAQNTVTQLDVDMWRKLKLVTVGRQGFVQEGWVGQGFSFSGDVPFGLVQNKGGPCGVLAVVQALVLRNLVFGSKFSKDVPMARNEILSTLQSENQNQTSSSYSSALTSKRSEALLCTLVEILWRCVPPELEKSCVKICLKGNEQGSELVKISGFQELEEFVRDNCYRFDCLGLVYSAVLTRGPDRIQLDMDFPDSPLIGQHGYCSLELINLLLFGKCTSNVFDNEVVLDGKTLGGIKSQSDIGFLSLFEHYGSCEVGSFFKSPKYPVWICCSESHFSVFFSPNVDIVSRDKENAIFNSGFDLFYYDGLAKQQQIIRLTICFPQTDHDRDKGTLLALPSNFSGISTDAVDGVGCDHLIPPLEKCIRTKWKNARVFWNGTEPLL